MEARPCRAHPTPEPYPGSTATAAEVFALAEEYRCAATLLLDRGRRLSHISWSPFRLAAIHATELYLNAALMQHGHSTDFVRRLQHDLGARSELAQKGGLKLRVRTAAHLTTLSASRDYLTVRYAPDRRRQSALNRMTATMNEVAAKVGRVLGSEARLAGQPPPSIH